MHEENRKDSVGKIRRSTRRLVRRSGSRPNSFQISFEQLESRRMLADLQVLDVYADGYGSVFVDYRLIGVDFFFIRWGIYASTDSVIGGGTDTPVKHFFTRHGPGWGDGTHTIGIPVPILEIDSDYFLLVLGDSDNRLGEDDIDPFNEDNTVVFKGAYQLGGNVYFHGSNGDDSVTLTNSGSNIILNANSLPAPLTYASADVNRIWFWGHSGNDILAASGINRSVFYFGGEGNDTGYGGSGNDVLAGGTGDDYLVGGLGNDSYQFDTGLGLGFDTLDESLGGVDTLDFSSTTTQAVVVSLAVASQIVNPGLTLSLGSGTNFENLIGGALGDTLTGNGLANVLVGSGGDDTLRGLGGNDTFRFDCDNALGTDTITETTGIETLDFSPTSTRSINVNLAIGTPQVVNAGLTLVLVAPLRIENLIGGELGDTLTGNALGNFLAGGPGDDRYCFDTGLGLGIDTLNEIAGGGVDTLDFSSTTTQTVSVSLAIAAAQVVNPGLTLSLGSGTRFENLIGGALGDTLTGSGRANVLAGSGGDDILKGLGGNDTYQFDCDNALGTDTLFEAGGIDTLDFSSTSTRSVKVNLANAAPQVVNAGLTLFLGSAVTIEKVVGGELGDRLTGNTLKNFFVGGPGNDVLTGGSNHDTYFFDTDSPLGTDSIYEVGVGIDLLDFRSTTTLPIMIDLSNAAPQVVNANLSLQLNSPTTIEKVIGGSKDDTIIGNSLNNVLLGGGGGDYVSGGEGRDILIGGGGADSLNGGADEDLLIAGTTAYDANQTALNVLRGEWISTARDYLTRVANLRSGVGGYRLQASGAGATVFNDGSYVQVDTLTGDADRDWFFAAAIDSITDLAIDELKDTLP